MVTARTVELDPRSISLTLLRHGAPLSWAAVRTGLVDDPTLRDALTAALVGTPFSALYWEARPVSPSDVDAPFESVILDAPSAPPSGHGSPPAALACG